MSLGSKTNSFISADSKVSAIESAPEDLWYIGIGRRDTEIKYLAGFDINTPRWVKNKCQAHFYYSLLFAHDMMNMVRESYVENLFMSYISKSDFVCEFIHDS